jgi:hypothetical protein
MNDDQTVAGAVAELKEGTEDFWAVLEGDEHLSKYDKAEITQLMEGAADNLDAIKKILHVISESE